MSPRVELLVPMRARLSGEALQFALAEERRLERLERPELELWEELAAIVAHQRPRERQDFLAISAEGLAQLSAAPHLRPEVHEWSRWWTRRSGRLGAAFLRLCHELLPSVSADTFRETVSMARGLEWDADTVIEFMAQAPQFGNARRASLSWKRVMRVLWHSGVWTGAPPAASWRRWAGQRVRSRQATYPGWPTSAPAPPAARVTQPRNCSGCFPSWQRACPWTESCGGSRRGSGSPPARTT